MIVEQLGFLINAPSQALVSLDLDQPEVVGVDLGDRQRDVLIHSSVRGVRRDDVACFDKLGFDRRADIGGQRREEQVDIVGNLVGISLDDRAVGDLVGNGRVDAPLCGVAVRSAGARFGGGERGDLEVRVRCEQLDESLSDGAGRAEDTYASGHWRSYGEP